MHCNNIFAQEVIIHKENKYHTLINNIQNQVWKIAPLFTIIASIRGAIYNNCQTKLKTSKHLKLKLIIPYEKHPKRNSSKRNILSHANNPYKNKT